MQKNEENETKEKIVNKRLPLTSDYIFKRVFAKDENNSMLKDFLEAILNLEIKKVIVKNPEISKDFSDEKYGVLDLKIEIDDDKVIDVEMQMKNEYNIAKRSSTYLAKLVAEQLKSGQEYKALKKVITINLLNFNLLERNSYHSIARMKFEKSTEIEFVDMGYTKEEEIATEVFEMHFIELQKFKKKNPNCSTKLEQWLWLLVGEKEDKIEMGVEVNKEIEKTVKILNELSLDEKEREAYDSRLRGLMRYKDNMECSKEDGIKLGKKLGEEKSRNAIVIEMLNNNFDDETICKIAKISKEELQKIKESIKK